MNDLYQRYFWAQLEDSFLFQDFVMREASRVGLVLQPYSSRYYQLKYGETMNRIEIKHDKQLKNTGNIYIETEERRGGEPGPLVPSGVMSGNHWMFVIGDYRGIFFFTTQVLLGLVQSGKYEKKTTLNSTGYIIPAKDAQENATIYIRPVVTMELLDEAARLEKAADDLRKQVLRSKNLKAS